MKIIEATTFLRGGAGVLTTQLACYLKKSGHEVTVFSTGSIDNLCDWEELQNELKLNQINHVLVNTFKREGEYFWQSVKLVADFLQNQAVDVIHVHAGVPALIMKMAQQLSGLEIPILATFHSWSPDRPAWMNIADTTSFNYSDYVVYDSEYYQNLGKMYQITPPSKVIYPFVANKYMLFNPSNSRGTTINKYKLPQQVRFISNLAEITERKGQLQLVEAFAIIHHQFPDVHLLLIGESKNDIYYSFIQDVIKRNQLESKVHIVGWLENPFELLRLTELFVFPSYSEGLGMAIIESILLEVPTIFSYKEGMMDIAHILGPSTFGTIDPSQIDQIADTILRVLNMNNKEKNKKVIESKRKLEEVFDFNYMAKEYSKLLAHLYSKRA